MRLSVFLSVYVGLTIFKVNKLLTLTYLMLIIVGHVDIFNAESNIIIAGFVPSMFYILLVIFIFSFRFVIVLQELVELGGVDVVVGGEKEVLAVDGPSYHK